MMCGKTGIFGARYTCNETCPHTYAECIKNRGLSLTDEKIEMKKQAKRNLTSLFSKNSSQRIYCAAWTFQDSLFNGTKMYAG